MWNAQRVSKLQHLHCSAFAHNYTNGGRGAYLNLLLPAVDHRDYRRKTNNHALLFFFESLIPLS